MLRYHSIYQPQSNHTKCTIPEWREYYDACSHLDAVLTRSAQAAVPGDKATFLRPAAHKVFSEVRNIAQSSKRRIPLEVLSEILDAVADVILGPDPYVRDDTEYREAIRYLYKLKRKIRRFPSGKLLGAALATVLGASIIAASGVVAAIGFGLTLPVSVFGVILGASLVTGGSALGGVGAGSGLLTISGTLFARALTPSPLVNAMNELGQLAKETYHVKRSCFW